MTIVMRLKAPFHFRMRAVEWLVSGVLVSWGLILAGHDDVIGGAQFAKLARIGPQRFWSACCLAAGTARFGALFVNGAWRHSPCARMVLALGSRLFWLQISLRFVSARPAWVQVVVSVVGGAASAGVAAWAQRKGNAGREQAAASQEATVVAAAMSGSNHDQLVLEAVKRLGDGMNYADRSLDGICAAQDRTTSAVDRLTAAVDRQERATRYLHGDRRSPESEVGLTDIRGYRAGRSPRGGLCVSALSGPTAGPSFTQAGARLARPQARRRRRPRSGLGSAGAADRHLRCSPSWRVCEPAETPFGASPPGRLRPDSVYHPSPSLKRGGPHPMARAGPST